MQLRAAKQAEERALAKYRTELQNHSADAQELTKAKEVRAPYSACFTQSRPFGGSTRSTCILRDTSLDGSSCLTSRCDPEHILVAVAHLATRLVAFSQAAAAAEESLRAAVAARATAESEASNARALAAAAKAEVASRIKEVEERLAAAAEENKLLHAQLTKLAAYATVAAATTASSPAGRREMGAIAAGTSRSCEAY